MKKLLIGCAVAAMMLTPVASKAGSNDWVGPAIVGTIFGVMIANSGHGHAEVYVDNRRRYDRARRHRRHYFHEWVEVCKPYTRLRRDRWGDYYTVMRRECRMVKRAIW